MEHTELYRGYTIEIHQDDDPIDPIKDQDNLATLSCFHKRYDLSSPYNEFDNVEELDKHIRRKDVISLPLYLYDHGGLAMSTTPFSNRWDSGKLGYIHVVKQKVRNQMGWKIITAKRLERVYNMLRGFINTVDDYLHGYTYGFKIIAPDGETVDSCWGYYGDDHEQNGILPECRSFIDSYIKHTGEEWEQGAPPPGWICTDPDNMQFAKKVNETTWTYRQLTDDIELACGHYLNDLARFQQIWFTDLMWEEKTIDANDYTEPEQWNEVSGFYTREQFADFRHTDDWQMICECIFENNLTFTSVKMINNIY